MIRKKNLLWVCLALFTVSCSSRKETENKTAKSVETAEVQRISYETVERTYSFISRPYKSVDLSFRVGGPIERFDAQSGKFYRKGEVIAAIDSRDFVIRKDEAEAVFRQAEAEFKRIANLYTQDNISGSAYEKAKADHARAKAAYEKATNELKDTQLLAPFDGYVQEIKIEQHQEVKASVPVLSFIDLSRIKIEAYIPEDMAKAFHRQKDMPCRISFAGLDEKTFEATETFISQTAMDNNISFLLTAIVENKDNSLFGGMSGEVSLPILSVSGKTIVCVPQTAVFQQASNGAAVWKINKENCVQCTAVELGDTYGKNQIEILSGLQVGDRIVTSGIYTLSENEQISIL